MDKTAPARIGMIGLGKMGVLHAGIFNALPNAEVRAMCDKDALLIKMGKKVFPDIGLYTDFKKMIEKEELDAVVITTPIHTHAPITKDLLTNGHSPAIFVEKPLASDFSSASQVSELAQEKGIVTGVGYQKRYASTFREGKRLLEEGILGELLFFKSHSYVSYIFRQSKGWRFEEGSGGALLELGVHLVDLLPWYFGDWISVKTVKRQLYSGKVEDYMHAMIEFDSGLVGSIDISWSIRNYRLHENCIEVHGQNGILTVNEDYIKLQLDEPAGIYSQGVTVIYKQAFDDNLPFLLADPEFVKQDQEFVDCVLNGKATSTSFEKTTKTNALMDAMYNGTANKGEV